MKTIARQFAEYALNITYDDLSTEVRHQAKKLLLDTIGCAIGGYTSDAAEVLRGWACHFKEPAESTIIGDGTKIPSTHAALVNGAMVRYLEYNDVYFPDGHPLMGAHPSEIIPSILAVGELQHSTGRDVMAAIVAGYELSARFTDGCSRKTSLAERGFNIDLRGGFITPPIIGKLLGLNADQIENAIGISGCRATLLGIVDAANEEFTMGKSLRFAWSAHDGMVATFLSQRGFTGPKNVMEGQQGFVDSVMHGDFDFKKCTDLTGFKIMETSFKPFCSCGLTHGHLTATLHLVSSHNIKPEDVAEIRVWASPQNVEHTGQATKRYPKNKETADHSSYYLTAIAIMDRRVGINQFSPEKFADPMVRNLNDRMTFEGAPELAQFIAAGITEITTTQGARYKHQVNYPKGNPRNAMSDQELRMKFQDMASKFMSDKEIEKVIKTVSELENLTDIGDLMKLLVFKT